MVHGVRKLAARLFLAVLAPVLALGLTEAALRAVDAGYPTGFLRPFVKEGRPCRVNNSFYGYRFFEPRMARNPAPLRIWTAKPPGLVRIAVLGESAAMGDPAIEFSIARGLEKMLNEPARTQRFEVINAAMTAISSPVVVDIAEDMMKCDVDALIVYMGNNEVVGPYGPGTVLTDGDWGVRLTPWRVALTRLRLSGLLRQVVQSVATPAKEESKGWAGMEMFQQNRISADDPRLGPMYRRYERNLSAIIDKAERKGIRVIVCSMAVNLSDCAPFGSTNRTTITKAELREWNTAFKNGRLAQQDGRNAEALAAYKAAMEMDDQHAELNYRLGLVQRALGNRDEASRLFSHARDLDVQRFRTDSVLNGIIRRVVARKPNVVFADIEQAFGTREDKDLFVDHVHFSMSGLYLICSELRAVMKAWYNTPAELDQEMFLARLMRTPWSERKETAFMLGRREHQPFSMQQGNVEHMEQLKLRLSDLNETIKLADLESVGEAFKASQMRDPEDLFYPLQWGHILCVEEKWEMAASTLTTATDMLGGYTDVHSLAALSRAMSGEPEQAAGVLLRTGPPYGYYLADACLLVIETLSNKGMLDTAQQFIEAVLDNASRFPRREELETLLKTSLANPHAQP